LGKQKAEIGQAKQKLGPVKYGKDFTGQGKQKAAVRKAEIWKAESRNHQSKSRNWAR
jgi:hypothetical protein